MDFTSKWMYSLQWKDAITKIKFRPIIYQRASLKLICLVIVDFRRWRNWWVGIYPCAHIECDTKSSLMWLWWINTLKELPYGCHTHSEGKLSLRQSFFFFFFKSQCDRYIFFFCNLFQFSWLSPLVGTNFVDHSQFLWFW